MSRQEAFQATLFVLFAILGNTGCDTDRKPRSPEASTGVQAVEQAREYYICEIHKFNTGHESQWTPYKISSHDGVLAIRQWISEHRDAIAKSKEAGLLDMIPETTLAEISKDGTVSIPLIRRLPDPRDDGKTKAKRRYIDNIPMDDMKQLHDAVLKHGKPIDWSTEEVEFPGAFMSHPRGYEPLPEGGGT